MHIGVSKLEVQAKRIKEHVSSVADVAPASLLQEVDLNVFLGRLLLIMTDRIRCESGVIWLRKGRTRRFRRVATVQDHAIVPASDKAVAHAANPLLTLTTESMDALNDRCARSFEMNVDDHRFTGEQTKALRAQGIQVLAALPVKLGNRLIGVASLRRRRMEAFSGAEIDWAVDLCAQAGLALRLHELEKAADRSELLETAMKRVKAEAAERKRAERIARAQAAMLSQGIKALAELRDLDGFLSRLLVALSEQLETFRCGVWACGAEPSSSYLYLGVQNGHVVSQPPSRTASLIVPILQEAHLASALLEQRKSLIVDIEANKPKIPESKRDELKSLGISQVLLIPLSLGNEQNGLLVAARNNRRGFDAHDVDLGESLSHQIALAFHLRALSDEARQRAALEERARIARDIHDTLAQAFTGVIVQTAAASRVVETDSEAARRHLAQANELARQGLSEARRSVSALREAAVTPAGLEESLRKLALQMTSDTATVSFRSAGAHKALSPPTPDHLFRIAQEAVTNSLKHSGARTIEVALEYAGGAVVLTITDDGIGFSSRMKNGSQAEEFGILGMRERAKTIDATLRVTSKRGKGTTVVVTAPI